MTKLPLAASLFVLYVVISGCVFREDGVFKQIGDSNYKLKINILNMFAVGEVRPTYLFGAVLLEDCITPLKNARVLLKNTNGQILISGINADNSGRFTMSKILSEDSYVVEVDSTDYVGSKVLVVESDKNYRFAVIAHKKGP